MSRNYNTIIRMGATSYGMEVTSERGNVSLDFSLMTPTQFNAVTRSYVAYYRQLSADMSRRKEWNRVQKQKRKAKALRNRAAEDISEAA